MFETGFFILIGLLSGVVSGMTGASGVMILIPVLTSFFGFSLFQAVGTSLMADIISSPVIAYTYYKNNNLNIAAAIWLIIGAVIGAQVGVEGTNMFPDAWVLITFSVGVCGLGIKFLYSKDLQSFRHNKQIADSWSQHTSQRIVAGLVLGFLSGVITGIFGSGGGILYFLILHFVLRLDLKTSIGTAAFVMIAGSLSAAWGHWQMGNLNLETGMILGIAAAVGGMFAGHIATRTSDEMLARVVGIIFILLGIMMIAVRFIYT